MNDRAQALATALIRNIHSAPSRHMARPPLYDATTAPLTLGTAAQKLGARAITLPPGKRGCPYHLHHAQEEMFVVMSGQGTLRVAGELLPLQQGDVVTIPAGPAYPHQILNTSDQPLTYLAISTLESPEICEYPDSGKFLAESIQGSTTHFDVIHKAGDSADYWLDEP